MRPHHLPQPLRRAVTLLVLAAAVLVVAGTAHAWFASDATVGYVAIDSDEAHPDAPSFTSYLNLDAVPAATSHAITDEDTGSQRDTAPILLPFAFEFGGKSFSTVRANNNGFIHFDSVMMGVNQRGRDLDDGVISPAPNDAVAAYWEDLVPGTIKSYHDAPNKRFIIQYSGFTLQTSATLAGCTMGNAAGYTFQFQLYEDTFDILVLYVYAEPNEDVTTQDPCDDTPQYWDGEAGIEVDDLSILYPYPAAGPLQSHAIRYMPIPKPQARDMNNETLEDVPLPLVLDVLDSASLGYDITIETGPTNGVLDKPTGTPFTGNNVLYTPDPDFFGTDTFTYFAKGPLGNGRTATVTLNIKPVNDAPVLVNAGDIVIQHDLGPQAYAWTLPARPGPPNEVSQRFFTVLTNTSNPSIFQSTPVFSPYDGVLYFHSAKGRAGTTQIQIYLQDNNGTANNGSDDVEVTFNLTISPDPNAPPALENGTLQVFRRSITGIQRPGLWATDDYSVNKDLVYTVLASPAYGDLQRGFVTLGVGDTFTQDDLANLRIRYSHADVTQTLDRFVVELRDSLGGYVGPANVTLDIIESSRFSPPDLDSDGIPDGADNCAGTPNPRQEDSDGDGIGDACAPEPDPVPQPAITDPLGNGPDTLPLDSDGDGIADISDNCPAIKNPGQENQDLDRLGDACDDDLDGDGFNQRGDDATDNCPLVPNPSQKDTDGDGVGDACDGVLASLQAGGAGTVHNTTCTSLACEAAVVKTSPVQRVLTGVAITVGTLAVVGLAVGLTLWARRQR